MFDQAVRLKLRFETKRGQVSAEDLWDLPLTELDRVAVQLQSKLRESANETSFITPAGPKDNAMQLRFDVAKHIIDVRLKERDDAKAARDKSAKKQQLLEVLARKQNAELEGKSTEELTAMINSL